MGGWKSQYTNGQWLAKLGINTTLSSSTARLKFPHGSCNVIYWQQWSQRVENVHNLEKLILVFEVKDFECSPRPPERQTREMWRIMRDTKPLFPSSPTDPAKDPRDLTTMFFHKSLFSFTTFSFTRDFAQFEVNVTCDQPGNVVNVNYGVL